MSYSPIGDVEAGTSWGDKGPDSSYLFAERTVRQGFVRKVFALLSLQLLMTAGVTALFSLHSPTRTYMLTNMWPFWTSFAGSLVLILIMSFYPDARRAHPYNLMMLFGFTAFESVLVGTVSAIYAPATVLLAVGITAGVVVGLLLFTMQTKVDFTAHSGVLYSMLCVLFFTSLLQIFLRVPVLHLVIAVGGALLFSVYLVFDLQMLMGGGKYSMSPDEYVFATLTLYLDVINLFLYILQLVNEAQRH